MSDQSESGEASTPPEPPRPGRLLRGIQYVRAYFQNRRADKAQESATDRAGRRTAIATVWIAIFTAATVGIGISHYFAFHGQLQTMQGQLREMIASGKQTDQLITTNRDTMVAAARAWIAPTLIELRQPLKVGQPIVSTIYFKNVGNEPALDLAAANAPVITEAQPRGSDLRDIKIGPNQTCEGLEPITGGQVVYPGSEIGLSISTGPLLATREMVAGTWLYYIQGCFVYRTMGSVHRSGFCQYLSPGTVIPTDKWNYAECHTGNFAD